MANRGPLKALCDPEPLALRIATKSAFLASRTAKDAAISTLAQQSAEHARLQEIHRGLIVQLEQKQTQILGLKEIAAKAQNVWAGEKLDLNRAAETARSALSQEEAEHARLKELYRDCVTELERKDAEILNLHSTITGLSSEHNNATQSASAQYEAELTRLQIFSQTQTAEIKQKSLQITRLDRTIKRLAGENRALEEPEAGLREAVTGRTRDFEHAADAAAASLAQHEAEKRQLQNAIRGQSAQIAEKEAQILDLQNTSESLVQEKNNLKSEADSARDATARKAWFLKLTTSALSEVTAAKAVVDQRVTALLATIEALENEALRCKKQLRDTANSQSETETKRRDAVNKVMKVQAASDQLRRENTSLSAKVDSLQARKSSLAKQSVNAADVHARTKEDLCNATKTVSELRVSAATAFDNNASLAARLEQLRLEKKTPQVQLESLPPPVVGVLHQKRGIQDPPLPVQTAWVCDDSDLYDWNDAKAYGLFDFWSNNLHGSEIMPLLSIEASQDHMVICISKLIFDQESNGLIGWLTQRSQDHNFEQMRLRIVHLLNDSMRHYSCKCHSVHIYPNGSRDQDIHARCALEVLRVYGNSEDASSMFGAVLSCLSGEFCLEYLEECDIYLDRIECERLTQRCQDKQRGISI